MIESRQIKRLFSKLRLKWSLPILLIIACQLFTSHAYWVESYYSVGIYPFISKVQRSLLGWLPFSFGDICYAIFLLYLCIKSIKVVIALIRRQYSFLQFKRQMGTVLYTCLWIYIVFIGIWGFNYHRLGIASQLQLSNTEYSDAELKDLLCDVVDEINETRTQLGDSNYAYPSEKQLVAEAVAAYDNIYHNFPFLNYKSVSVKPSLLTTMVSYAGYSGYYNPFSGEAQVNTDLPKFYMPFVTCHEMGHQLGYASESEASFVGYLAAINSKDILLRYSALYEIFATANGELFERDFWCAILNIKSLNPLVRRDRRIYRDYILGKQNNVEPVIKNVYDKYLKANQQKSGINSYDEVVGWLIAYNKKYGKGK